MKLTDIVERIDGELQPSGFRRRKLTWNRRLNDQVDVVNLQGSKSGDRVTMNIGVCLPAVYELVWGKSPGDFILEVDCTVRTRLTDARGIELWWLASDPQAHSQMVTTLREQGLPFMDRMHSMESMEEWLSERSRRSRFPEAVHLAIIKAMRGNQVDACSLLQDLGTRALGDWRLRAAEVMHRLGCRR